MRQFDQVINYENRNLGECLKEEADFGEECQRKAESIILHKFVDAATDKSVDKIFTLVRREERRCFAKLRSQHRSEEVPPRSERSKKVLKKLEEYQCQVWRKGWSLARWAGSSTSGEAVRRPWAEVARRGPHGRWSLFFKGRGVL